MISTSLPKQVVTLEDFLTLPESKPAQEFKQGKIQQKPMPQGKHSTLQSELVSLINQQIKPNRSGYAFPELRCTFGNRSIVADISVFRWQMIPFEQTGEVANRVLIPPDWIIEILSPQQSALLPIDKIIFCLREGAELGWLIDPQERLVLVFKQDQLPETFQSDESLPVHSILSGWQINPEQIFSLLHLT